MGKNYIGVLDMGFEGLVTLEGLNEILKNENFIYINDVNYAPYEGKSQEEILERVSNSIYRLQKYDIKMLIVVSDTIIEYTEDFMNSLAFPVINIVSTLVDYVNDFYEQKNMVLLGKQAILEANLYQKNIKYNHLYNVTCDKLNDVIENKKVKTTDSFSSVQTLFKQLSKKDLDIVITSSPYLMLLSTEINEFISVSEITNVGKILGIKAKEVLQERGIINKKGRGHVYVCLKTNEIDYQNTCKKYVKKCKFLEDF